MHIETACVIQVALNVLNCVMLTYGSPLAILQSLWLQYPPWSSMPAVPNSQWGGQQKKGRIGVREKRSDGERERDTQYDPTRLFRKTPGQLGGLETTDCLHERSGWSADRRNPGSYIMARIGRRSYFAAPQCRAGTHVLSHHLFRSGERAPGTNHKTWGLKRLAGLRGERKREREGAEGLCVDRMESRSEQQELERIYRCRSLSWLDVGFSFEIFAMNFDMCTFKKRARKHENIEQVDCSSHKSYRTPGDLGNLNTWEKELEIFQFFFHCSFYCTFKIRFYFLYKRGKL